MEYSRILKEIYEEIQPYAQEGKPASYIPELLKVNPDRYGICLRTIEGKEYARETVMNVSPCRVFQKYFLLP